MAKERPDQHRKTASALRGTEAPQQRVRRVTKKLDFTLAGLKRALDQSDGKFDEKALSRNIAGTIRVVIRARSAIPEAWCVAH